MGTLSSAVQWIADHERIAIVDLNEIARHGTVRLAAHLYGVPVEHVAMAVADLVVARADRQAHCVQFAAAAR